MEKKGLWSCGEEVVEKKLEKKLWRRRSCGDEVGEKKKLWRRSWRRRSCGEEVVEEMKLKDFPLSLRHVKARGSSSSSSR